MTAETTAVGLAMTRSATSRVKAGRDIAHLQLVNSLFLLCYLKQGRCDPAGR